MPSDLLFDPTHKPVLKAGAAQVDITPQAGIPLTGFILRQNPSTGIHDRLFARALALEWGDRRAVLITCDLLGLDGSFVAAARTDIETATEGAVPGDCIMIVCTHTHSGPATIFVRDCGEVDDAYLGQLRGWLTETARKAFADLRPVRAGFGRGRVEKGVLNRRQPGAPIDPDVSVISLRDETGQNLAIIVNYACHPVCLDHTNTLLSADYPGVLARILEERTGAVVLFTNGAAGDINPQWMGSFAYAEELGGLLAEEVQRTIECMAYNEEAVLRIAREELELPLTPIPSLEELKKEMSERQRRLDKVVMAGDLMNIKIEKAMFGWAEDTLAAVSGGDAPTRIPTEIQAIGLDSVVLIGIPGEIFSGVGKVVKSDAPGCQAAVLGYTNNDIGYIPTREAYDRGGYEVTEAYKYYGYPAALSAEAGDLLRAAAGRLVKKCSSSPHFG